MLIKLLKLVSGEDVITQVENEDGFDGYLLKSPMKIIVSPMGVGMLGYLDCMLSDTCKIKDEHIMFEGEPETELKNAYNEKFGSGIVVPKSGGINLNTGG
jgi:hypothetical protein